MICCNRNIHCSDIELEFNSKHKLARLYYLLNTLKLYYIDISKVIVYYFNQLINYNYLVSVEQKNPRLSMT